MIFAAVYFAFGRAPSTLAIWIAMAVYGLYYALTQPVLKALVVQTVGEQVRGRALGDLFLCDQRGHLSCEFDHGRTLEALRRVDPVLFFGSDGARRSGNFAGSGTKFEHQSGNDCLTVMRG